MAAAPVASTSSTPDPSAVPRQPKDDEKPLDVSILKELARKALVDALNSVRASARHAQTTVLTLDRRAQVNGVKTLVLDNALAGPLGLVTEVSLLKVR